jgi:hypothetical protein
MAFVKGLNCTRSASLQEKLWEGEEKIVVAIDCGTTFSGVAYSYLYPKGHVYIQRVLQWPGQEGQKGLAKIPTLVWYDEKGQAQAFGAEATTHEIRTKACASDWQLAEHFKLHLHPSAIRAKHNIIVQPLPQGIPIEQIYADFFRYLYDNTRNFFLTREVDGANVWDRLKDRIEFVLPCPNGWGSWEFGLLRKAAVLGGLVQNSETSWRMHFVSEAEAAVHYLLAHTELGDQLKPNDCLLVCDAGGSTVDSTHYRVATREPKLNLKETQTSACIQAGAIFVDQAAASYFEKHLSSAGVEGDKLSDYVRAAVNSFEAGAKKAFKDTQQEDWSIDIEDHWFSNTSARIRRGLMQLSGSKIEPFFAPLVKQIKDSVKEQLKGQTTQYVLLVGGFGDSPYLQKRFLESSALRGIEIICANDTAAKAVAEGGAAWYIQHMVTARASRYSYGCGKTSARRILDLRQIGREVNDRNRVRHIWGSIVKKGRVMQEDEEWRVNAVASFDTREVKDRLIGTTIYVNTTDKEPHFFRDRKGKLTPGVHEACVVAIDIPDATKAVRKINVDGVDKWLLKCEIVVKFGESELTAHIVWKDADGKEQRGKAVVLPEKF